MTHSIFHLKFKKKKGEIRCVLQYNNSIGKVIHIVSAGGCENKVVISIIIILHSATESVQVIILFIHSLSYSPIRVQRPFPRKTPKSSMPYTETSQSPATDQTALELDVAYC
jgi:hypothetical protein